MAKEQKNPYRPGSGHQPPYLAGRQAAIEEFEEHLEQDVILTNVIITGLRGVGKTVLLDHLRPIAITANWFWVGTDLSESASISEESIATRLLADLAVVTSQFTVEFDAEDRAGFGDTSQNPRRLSMDFDYLLALFDTTPGLNSDKLKTVLEHVAGHVEASGSRGIIFAYDEAQNLQDHAAKQTFPMSILLDVFQSIQKKGIPFMLVLSGLQTLFPKLVGARTYTERMFHSILLGRLSDSDSREAILIPIREHELHPTEESVDVIVAESGGYPYFIQFICRELYDIWIRDFENPATVSVESILRKLDADFFAGRWARATDRQRDLLIVVAHLEGADVEFSVQEVVEKSQEVDVGSFGSSHAGQLISQLCECGLVYKHRHGRYSFAVPLLGRFILRQKQSRRT